MADIKFKWRHPYESPGYYFPDLSGWTNTEPEQVEETKTPTEKWIEEWLDELGTV